MGQKAGDAQDRGFTLVELLVVLAILALLMSILLPSLHRARQMAERTACLSNLSQIQKGMSNYASDNFGEYIICRGRRVQKAFNPGGVNVHGNRPEDKTVNWIDAMHSVGLAKKPKVKRKNMSKAQYQAADVWNCPTRDYESQWEAWFPQLVVSYQYFGGIENWRNFQGLFDARSPINVSTSKPNWVLAADATMKIDNVWGGTKNTRDSAYADMPSHKEPGSRFPAGGNQVYVDGSGEWIPAEKMIFIHSWNPSAREGYFWQQDLGDFQPSGADYLVPPDVKQ